MSDELLALIRSAKTGDINHTHVLLGPPYGKINVESRMDEFWDLYISSFNQGKPLYLAESPNREMPILVDIDLKTNKNGCVLTDGKIYTLDEVKTVIRSFQKACEQTFIDLKHDSLTCVLLEKPPYDIELNGIKYIKNGFHLHFPKLFCHTDCYDAYIVPLAKQMCESLFDRLSEFPCVFIDDKAVKVHWLMYGSHKTNNGPYIATRCFGRNATEITFDEALGDYIFPFSQSGSGDVMADMPKILSTALVDRSQYYYKSRESITTPLFDTFRSVKERRTEYRQRTVTENIKEIEILLGMLNPQRADERSDWLSVGFCIWNITDGDSDGMSLWLEFSEKSVKYREEECLCIWANMRENHYTIGTLKYFAKQDSPEEYEEYVKKVDKQLLYMSIDGGHNDLAKLLYNNYGNQFIYSPDNNTWYMYDKHIWHPNDNCYGLRSQISDEKGVLYIFEQYIKQLLAEQRENPENEKEYNEKIKLLRRTMKSCKSANFKNNVMTECKEVFYNDKFYHRLNKDPNLIAFKNGVYDFSADCFRNGKPEDFLSVSLPIEYVDYGSVNHPCVLEVNDHFRKVFPDEEIRSYFLDQMCRVFVGGNHDKVILFWMGCTGNNGKTVTQTMFEKMLGPLAVKLPTSLITGKKKQCGQAAPELARCGNGVRWAVMEEPNQDELINSGDLKSYTGNDSYWARDLFERGKSVREITPLFKLHMICNHLPGIRDGDEATWSRIRVIPFESKFIPESQCPPDDETRMARKVFPEDKSFSSKMDRLLQPLAFFLINRWRRVSKSDHTVPDKVKIATSAYQQDNNIYQQYIDEFIIVLDEHNSIASDALYAKFKDWFRANTSGHHVPTKSVFINRLSEILKIHPSGIYKTFYGIGFKSDDHPMLN